MLHQHTETPSCGECGRYSKSPYRISGTDSRAPLHLRTGL